MVRLDQVDEGVYTAGQLDTDDFAALAQQGVKTIVNNRPDGEDPDQLTAAEGAALAADQGIAYHHIPFGREGPTPAQIAQFATLLAEAPRPMVAHCRSGARSTNLVSMARMHRRTGG